MQRKIFFSILFCLPLFGDYDLPWSTGTIIASSGTVQPFHTFNVQPYILVLNESSTYSSSGNVISQPPVFISNYQIQAQYGILPSMDIIAFGQFFVSRTQNQTSVDLGPTTLSTSFQLANQWVSNVLLQMRLLISETFPTGDFSASRQQHQQLTSTTNGSFRTGMNLILAVTHFPHRFEYFTHTCNFVYLYQTQKNAKGITFYGGADDTDGRFIPKGIFILTYAFQIGMTKKLELLSDLNFFYQGNVKFRGFPGTGNHGQLLNLNQNDSYLFTLTPGFGYSFSANQGIIASAWLTAFGKNSAVQRGFVFSYSATF